MNDDLTRDEPPTQEDLDSKSRRCPDCGRVACAMSPRVWHCACGHNWKRDVILCEGKRLVIR